MRNCQDVLSAIAENPEDLCLMKIIMRNLSKVTSESYIREACFPQLSDSTKCWNQGENARRQGAHHVDVRGRNAGCVLDHNVLFLVLIQGCFSHWVLLLGKVFNEALLEMVTPLMHLHLTNPCVFFPLGFSLEILSSMYMCISIQV